MYIVNFPCPRCAAERTVRLSAGRPLCLSCLLRRRRADVGGCAAPEPASGAEHAPGSAA
jgi:hypothetical protein